MSFYSTVSILSQIIGDSVYLNSVCFIDEAAVHISGKVNCHNCHIWGLQNPHDVRELDRDSPELNMWCGLISAVVIRPFFFHEETVSVAVYFDKLENCAVPQVPDGYSFQHGGAPPHFWTPVPEFLNEQLTGVWVILGGPILWVTRSPELSPPLTTPLRLPNLIPVDFILEGYIRYMCIRPELITCLICTVGSFIQ
jgi:hypothetical protein